MYATPFGNSFRQYCLALIQCSLDQFGLALVYAALGFPLVFVALSRAKYCVEYYTILSYCGEKMAWRTSGLVTLEAAGALFSRTTHDSLSEARHPTNNHTAPN